MHDSQTCALNQTNSKLERKWHLNKLEDLYLARKKSLLLHKQRKNNNNNKGFPKVGTSYLYH